VPQILPLLLLPLCWLLLIRPQRQRVARQHEMLTSLRPGDEVVTAGGLLGRVVQVGADRISLEVGPGLVIEVVPPAVTSRRGSAEVAAVEAPATAGEDQG